jgi:translation elongation factor EF-G
MVLTMMLTPRKWHLKLLVQWALKQGARKAQPVLLEPYMKVEVVQFQKNIWVILLVI